jgi:hypothetical protein
MACTVTFLAAAGGISSLATGYIGYRFGPQVLEPAQPAPSKRRVSCFSSHPSDLQYLKLTCSCFVLFQPVIGAPTDCKHVESGIDGLLLTASFVPFLLCSYLVAILPSSSSHSIPFGCSQCSPCRGQRRPREGGIPAPRKSSAACRPLSLLPPFAFPPACYLSSSLPVFLPPCLEPPLMYIVCWLQALPSYYLKSSLSAFASASSAAYSLVQRAPEPSVGQKVSIPSVVSTPFQLPGLRLTRPAPCLQFKIGSPTDFVHTKGHSLAKAEEETQPVSVSLPAYCSTLRPLTDSAPHFACLRPSTDRRPLPRSARSPRTTRYPLPNLHPPASLLSTLRYLARSYVSCLPFF